VKFWQLTSLLRDTPSSVRQASQLKAEWTRYGDWCANEKQLIVTQDREKLDATLPDEFVRAVLSRVDMSFYVDTEGWIRLRRENSSDTRMTALEAFNRFGGELLEDALEKGCSRQQA
jgi:hypothetical protein